MYLKEIWRQARTLFALVLVATSMMSALAYAQNLPPPGAYQPIPNFSGVGAGLQFRNAINGRFSGAQSIAPSIVSISFANLPAEQDGLQIFCKDCKHTTPCAAGGTGGWALGSRGIWTCLGDPIEANLNANGNKVSNLASGAASGEALAFGQTGAQLQGLSSVSGQAASAIINNFSVNGGINPRDPKYGAKGDNTTDDTAAIQTAYNAAQAFTIGTSAPLTLPPGNYRTTFPLIFYGGAAGSGFGRVVGAGGIPTVVSQTNINASGIFPATMVVPWDYITPLGTISAAPIVGSTGHSLQFNSGNPYFLLLNEVPMVGAGSANNPNPLNGQSNLTVQFYFTTPAANGTTVRIFSDATNFDVIKFTVGGGATALLNVNGGLNGVIGAGTVAANTTYWCAVVKDAANSKIWLYLAAPGASGVTPLSSGPSTGNIVEPVADTLSLGGQTSGGWPPGAMDTGDAFIGKVQSFDVEKTALYPGSTVTAPSANFSGGANTLYLNNFTSIAPTKNGVANTPVVSVDYLNGTAQSNAWQAIWTANYDGNGRGPEVTDLGISGGTVGLFWAMAPGGTFRNLQFLNQTYGSFLSTNNTYDSFMENITMFPDGFAAFGLGCGWFIGQGYGIKVVGSYYPIAAGVSTCGTLIHPIEVGSNATLAGIITGSAASVFSGSAIVDNESDLENGGNTNGIEFPAANAGFFDLVGGTYGSSGTGNPIQYDGTGPVLNVHGARLFPSEDGTGPSSASINFANLAANPAPVVNLFGTTISAGIPDAPLTNQPLWVSTAGCGGVVTLVAGAGTLTNKCVTTASICKGIDTTTFANAVTFAAPAMGSVAITGTGIDVIKAECQ